MASSTTYVMMPESMTSGNTDVPPPVDPSFSSMEGSKRGPKPKDPDALLSSKLWRAIKIAIKLHFGGGVDEEGRLLDDERKPVNGADLISLIHYAVSRGRARNGEIEFIKALHQARIPADWIVNEDIKMKYLGFAPVNRVPSELAGPPRAGAAPSAAEPRINVEYAPTEEMDESRFEANIETPERNELRGWGSEPPIKTIKLRKKSPYTRHNKRWEIID